MLPNAPSLAIIFIFIPTINNVIANETNKMILFVEKILSMSTNFAKVFVTIDGRGGSCIFAKGADIYKLVQDMNKLFIYAINGLLTWLIVFT